MFNFFKRKKKLNRPSILPDEIEDNLLAVINSNSQACRDTDEIEGASGPFGLSPSNPVPVYGFISNEIYLGRLRTLDGKSIRWRRIGSTVHDDINMPIDNYEIFNEKGTTITHIYISPYHLRTSTKAPAGFKLEP